MTIFGNDASHYDEPLGSRDGLSFYTHKCTDGAHYYMDAEYQVAMNKAKLLGIPILGAYHVLWGANVNSQMEWFYNQVNTLTPWWKTTPFMWQLDCEPFSYNGGRPSSLAIDAAINYLVGKGVTRNSIVGYCPRWVYNDSLNGLPIRLWASSYVSGSGPYKTLYPGDGSARWVAYSGQTPMFLQYTSSAVIAGQTTCDANAFRGTEAELINEIGGEMPLSSDDLKAIQNIVWHSDIDSNSERVISGGTALLSVFDRAAQTIDINALAAAIVAKLPTQPLTKQDIIDAITETIKVG